MIWRTLNSCDHKVNAVLTALRYGDKLALIDLSDESDIIVIDIDRHINSTDTLTIELELIA